jgi:hypothetical protein
MYQGGQARVPSLAPPPFDPYGMLRETLTSPRVSCTSFLLIPNVPSEHTGGMYGASTDPVGTREARMGHHGSSGHKKVGNESWGHMEVGENEAFTVRSMVTNPNEERGGDQRYSLPKGIVTQQGLMLSSNCVSC